MVAEQQNILGPFLVEDNGLGLMSSDEQRIGTEATMLHCVIFVCAPGLHAYRIEPELR